MLRAFSHRLGVVGLNLTIFKLEPTTPNMSQHIATTWPNARKMLRPTMLRYVALASCDRLAGNHSPAVRGSAATLTADHQWEARPIKKLTSMNNLPGIGYRYLRKELWDRQGANMQVARSMTKRCFDVQEKHRHAKRAWVIFLWLEHS